MTTRDNRDYIRVLLYSYYTTITGWGVLLRNPKQTGNLHYGIFGTGILNNREPTLWHFWDRYFEQPPLVVAAAAAASSNAREMQFGTLENFTQSV